MLRVRNTPAKWDARSMVWRLVGVLVLVTFPVWWLAAVCVHDDRARGGAFAKARELLVEAFVLVITGNELDYDENGEEIW